MTRNTGGGSNAFMACLGELRKGVTAAELSSELAGLVEAVQRTGKKGELKLTLRLTQTGEGIIHVDDDIRVVTPKLDQKPTLFFATEDNRLQRTDPNQGELELRVTEGGQAPTPSDFQNQAG